MSSMEKRPREDAEHAAMWFFSAMGGWRTVGRYLRCGSLRRGLEKIGDIEIVCIPNKDAAGNNLLWFALDRLLAEGKLVDSVTGKDGKTTKAWGNLYRKFTFQPPTEGAEGWHFDIFSADEDNFWLQTVIRTGNDVFSRRLMSSIKAQGVYRIGEGYIRPSFEKRGDFPEDPKRGLTDKYIRELPIIPAESEEFVLALAGQDFILPPERRTWTDR